MVLRFISAVGYIGCEYCKYITIFQSIFPTDGHFIFFQFLAIMNKTTMNILEFIILCMFSFLLIKYLQVESPRHRIGLISLETAN